MQLAQYLTEKDISDAAFAARIGVSRQAVARYKSGERRPEWDVLDRIRDETEGVVTPNDFLDPPVAPTSAATAPEPARAGA